MGNATACLLDCATACSIATVFSGAIYTIDHDSIATCSPSLRFVVLRASVRRAAGFHRLGFRYQMQLGGTRADGARCKGHMKSVLHEWEGERESVRCINRDGAGIYQPGGAGISIAAARACRSRWSGHVDRRIDIPTPAAVQLHAPSLCFMLLSTPASLKNVRASVAVALNTPPPGHHAPS